VVDERDGEVPWGQVGELIVRGPGIMRGYLHQPGATAKEIGLFVKQRVAPHKYPGRVHLGAELPRKLRPTRFGGARWWWPSESRRGGIGRRSPSFTRPPMIAIAALTETNGLLARGPCSLHTQGLAVPEMAPIPGQCGPLSRLHGWRLQWSVGRKTHKI
jgi:acyl-CoA synthetase (AMP-forming)/AMP-acid ligase II